MSARAVPPLDVAALAPRCLPPLPDDENARDLPAGGFDLARSLRGLSAPLVTALRRRRSWNSAQGALRFEAEITGMDEDSLRHAWLAASADARRAPLHGAARARRLALLRESTYRATGLLAHPVQLVAVDALADRTGVEMATGEGKTLVTMMAAAMQAAEGWPVHVITANEYLAGRDHAGAGDLFARLGLSSAVIGPDDPPTVRRAAYLSDVVYASAKDIAFDHLRDRIALGGITRRGLKLSALTGQRAAPIMRGLWSAIVDEADSVLIDEARTPLIISAPGGDSEIGTIAAQAMEIVNHLHDGTDFAIVPGSDRPAALTDAGLDRAVMRAAPFGGVWSGVRRTRELVERALFAVHILQRDVAYILREDSVQIVDENTGRIMADRTWSDGLHQMVEIKEGLPPSEDRTTLGRVTFQRFFRRYRRLSGLSGTLAEVRRELLEIYGLAVMPVPTHRPPRRVHGPSRILPDRAGKWRAVAGAAEAHARAGRPVLIGTRTVGGAEAASAALTAQGIAHRVLSARQDAEEAAILEQAGQGGTVTVATNMAGRGADIRLSAEARAAGGLVVLLCERHEARRIDRQLIGRAARQGDPGQVDVFLSSEDDILGRDPPRAPKVADFDRAQAALERLHARQRYDLNRMEEGLNDMTAFAGGLE